MEGIGIKLGGNADFRVWGDFKLRAELFYSILYGFAKANLDYLQNGFYTLPSGEARGADAAYSQHQITSFFDSMLGVAWEQRYRGDSLYLELHAGWRFQTFAQGWTEFEVEFDDAMNYLPLAGQGLQIGATFKF